LFLAAQFLDLLWPILLLIGVEHVRIAPGITQFTPLDFSDHPITHSLLMACVWGALFGFIDWVCRRDLCVVLCSRRVRGEPSGPGLD